MNSENKKQILAVIISGLMVVFLSSVFYYVFFLKPLRENGELFPENKASKDSNIQQKTKKNIPIEIVEKYGITPDEIGEIDKDNLFFIDGREIEEYQNNHVAGSAHIRTLDIKNKEVIKEAFEINEEEFLSSIFVIYCHDGTRSADMTSKLNLENIKFLVGGVSVFYDGEKNTTGINLIPTGIPSIEKEFQDNDFTITVEESAKLLDGENLFIDGRLDVVDVFDFTREYRIGKLSSEDYQKAIDEILGYKEKNIVYIADTYGDMFYAKLMVQRLVKKYGFEKENFHVLFAQSESFYDYILKNNLILE